MLLGTATDFGRGGFGPTSPGGGGLNVMMTS
jgi:hypothetical protein